MRMVRRSHGYAQGMDHRDSAPAPRVRMTLAERKQQTREALVLAALAMFTRDGYHAAALDAIAAEAGYSKGAIYSNFTGKADLFLAVIDYNLEALQGGDWDPLGMTGTPGTESRDEDAGPDEEAAAMVRGFGLASLEFIATAARDEELTAALRERIQVMVDGYQRFAVTARPDDEVLPVEEVARLMTALDQGVSVLMLSGMFDVDGTLLRAGMRRLVDPGRAASDPQPGHGDRPPHPYVERVGELMRAHDES